MDKFVEIEVNPTVDIDPANAAFDVIFDTVTLANVAAIDGGTVILRNIMVKDDSGTAPDTIRFIFFRSDVKLGTPNDVPNLTDTEGDEVLSVAHFKLYQAASPASELQLVCGGMTLGYEQFNNQMTLNADTKDLYVACQSVNSVVDFVAVDDYLVKFVFERMTVHKDSIFV